MEAWSAYGASDRQDVYRLSQLQSPMDDTGLDSRVFVVCGKSVEEGVLTEAFAPFGKIQGVKLVRDKGVAYVKYDKASSAAAAIEALHETVLNEGRGPMLKVMIAEAPTRRSGPVRPGSEPQLAPDPDNVPPRSRLFMVVPKTAKAHSIEEEMGKFRDLEYCKVDLIASKGIVYCKYAKSSSALLALEAIHANDNMVAGYKVKCMIAEPKGKRGRLDAQQQTDPFGAVHQLLQVPPALDYGALSAAAAFMPATPLGAAAALRYLPASPSHSGTTGLAPGSSLDSRSASETLTAGGFTPPPPGASNGLATPMPGHAGSHHGGGALAGPAMTNGTHARHAGAAGGLPAGLSNAMAAAVASSVGFGGLPGIGLSNSFSFDRPGLQEAMGSSVVNTMNMGNLGLSHLQALAAYMGAANLGQGLGGLGGYSVPAGGHTPAGRGSLTGSMTPPPHDQADLSAATGVGGSGGRLARAGSESGGGGNATALTRLYVVHPKAISEDVLAFLFQSYPGMEYCDLKRDHATGHARGFCYVKYTTPESAAAAIEHLHGVEFPPGSKMCLKVMYAEPLAVRSGSGKATPALAPSCSLSARSDSNSSFVFMQQCSLAAGEEASAARLGSSEGASELCEHRSAEVAAVQNSLAHMSMPRQQQHHAAHCHPLPVAPQQQLQPEPNQSQQPELTSFDPSPPLKAGRRTLLPSPPGSEEAEQVAESAGALPAPVVAPDDRTLFTLLSRPLPSYALEHVFSRHGPIEWVQLRTDERYGIVRFRAPDAARAALDALHGSDILGEALSVTAHDPAATARNTKRPRVAA